MSRAKRKQPPAPPPPAPPGKVLMWLVVVTCVAVLSVLIWYARAILGELKLVGDNATASTRLLIALFVVMMFGGFVAAAFWAALKKALGKTEDAR